MKLPDKQGKGFSRGGNEQRYDWTWSMSDPQTIWELSFSRACSSKSVGKMRDPEEVL